MHSLWRELAPRTDTLQFTCCERIALLPGGHTGEDRVDAEPVKDTAAVRPGKMHRVAGCVWWQHREKWQSWNVFEDGMAKNSYEAEGGSKYG